MLYDAYVSYQYSGEGRSSEVVTFALKVLPEVLEKRHGFSLFIRGRDDSPGEGQGSEKWAELETDTRHHGIQQKA